MTQLTVIGDITVIGDRPRLLLDGCAEKGPGSNCFKTDVTDSYVLEQTMYDFGL
jgi:hypothetical protein